MVEATIGCCGRVGRAAGGVWRLLARHRSAVTAIEYALMASLIAVAIIGGVSGYAGNLGSMMSATFTRLAAAI